MQSIAERAWEKVHRGKRISELCFGFKENNLYHSRKECDRMISEKGTLLSDKKEEPLGSSFCMVRGKLCYRNLVGGKDIKCPEQNFLLRSFQVLQLLFPDSLDVLTEKKSHDKMFLSLITGR